MGDDHDPDPGGGQMKVNDVSSSKSALPATSVWAGGMKSSTESRVKLRSFEEIIQDATNNRNILEIKLQKNVSDSDPWLCPLIGFTGDPPPPPPLQKCAKLQ